MKMLEIKAMAFLISAIATTIQLFFESIEQLPFPFYNIFNLSTTETLLGTLVVFGGYFIFKDILKEGFHEQAR